MSSLSERLTRGSASPSQVDHARRLVADWQLLADLAFADLTLWVPLQDGAWWCVAQVRPLTAPTSQPDDLVGSEATGAAAVILCAQLGRAVEIRQGRGSTIAARPLDDGFVEVGGTSALDVYCPQGVVVVAGLVP